MKKQKLFFLMLVIAGLTLASCGNDEERPSMFTLNNTSHITDHGYIRCISSNPERSIYFVILCAPGVEISPLDKTTGYGDYLILGFISKRSSALVSGEYSTADETLGASIILNYDQDLGSGLNYSIESSEINTASIRVSGNSLEAAYTLTLTTGKTVSGYYKGSLTDITPSIKASLTGNTDDYTGNEAEDIVSCSLQ